MRSRSILRIVATALLLLVGGQIISPLLYAATDDHDADQADVHPGPCPDGPEQPCSDHCDCVCCPGHLRAVAVQLPRLWRIDRVEGQLRDPGRQPLPEGVRVRVFHPPIPA